MLASSHDQVRLAAELRQQFGAGSVQTFGGEGDGFLPAFQNAAFLLEHAHGRVRVAAVDIAFGLTQRDRCPLVHVFVGEGRALHDRHLRGPEGERRFLAAPHRDGRRLLAGDGLGHVGPAKKGNVGIGLTRAGSGWP